MQHYGSRLNTEPATHMSVPVQFKPPCPAQCRSLSLPCSDTAVQTPSMSTPTQLAVQGMSTSSHPQEHVKWQRGTTQGGLEAQRSANTKQNKSCRHANQCVLVRTLGVRLLKQPGGHVTTTTDAQCQSCQATGQAVCCSGFAALWQRRQGWLCRGDLLRSHPPPQGVRPEVPAAGCCRVHFFPLFLSPAPPTAPPLAFSFKALRAFSSCVHACRQDSSGQFDNVHASWRLLSKRLITRPVQRSKGVSSLYVPPSFWPGTQGPRRRTAVTQQQAASYGSGCRVGCGCCLRTHSSQQGFGHTSLGPFFGCFSGFAFPACSIDGGSMFSTAAAPSNRSGQQLLHPVTLLLQATCIPQVLCGPSPAAYLLANHCCANQRDAAGARGAGCVCCWM